MSETSIQSLSKRMVSNATVMYENKTKDISWEKHDNAEGILRQVFDKFRIENSLESQYTLKYIDLSTRSEMDFNDTILQTLQTDHIDMKLSHVDKVVTKQPTQVNVSKNMSYDNQHNFEQCSDTGKNSSYKKYICNTICIFRRKSI